jgi:orotate phosphoribosyltransferase
VENQSLTNFTTLVKVAADEGYISQKDIARLEAFQKNPSDEGWITL